ncbi:basic leucine zipper 2 isoform X2 [Benincasa hispida]|uniref:basic leucine zipper 2 isoform X2 n=1 Tax=Benincasa hispida TaxID=102211 RepID=UPI0018FFA710|nr:basic leucine zipper 2 isoform X2 [Benincasa hispida]
MSARQTHLPPRPRCSIQKKTIAGPINGSTAPTPTVNEFSLHHDNYSSPSSMLEDEPVWLGELLSDREPNSIGQPLRRSASDSVTLLDGLADSLRSLCIAKDVENSVSNETCEQWDPSCTYGPNSPRRKCSSDFSNYSMVSALSEFVRLHHAAPVHADVCSLAEKSSSNSNGNISESVRDVNSDENAAKRHNGQRSRVRKLQYIAELERKVNVLQTVESQLAIRVASLLQERVALSMENSQLKQQVARVRREKLTSEEYKRQGGFSFILPKPAA